MDTKRVMKITTTNKFTWAPISISRIVVVATGIDSDTIPFPDQLKEIEGQLFVSLGRYGVYRKSPCHDRSLAPPLIGYDRDVLAEPNEVLLCLEATWGTLTFLRENGTVVNLPISTRGYDWKTSVIEILELDAPQPRYRGSQGQVRAAWRATPLVNCFRLLYDDE